VTNIRELLDEATRDVVADPHDATDRVRRGLRAHRKNKAAIVAVVAVVVAAIVVPLSLSPDGSGSVRPGQAPTSSTGQPGIAVWASGDGSVATGFGALWAVQCCGGDGGPVEVDRLDPNTGERSAKITVPGPAASVAAGAGRIWILGASELGPSAISVIDPISLHVTTMPLTNSRLEPYHVAFAAGSAWVTFQLANQVWRLTPTATEVQKRVLDLSGGPTDIATTGNGQIWVQRISPKRLTRLIPSGPREVQVGETVSWGSNIFSAVSPPKNLLASGAGGSVGWLEPSLLNECLACAQGGGAVARGQVIAVLQSNRGWWVTTTKRTYFYDHKSLRNGGQPTASIPIIGSSLGEAANGVVIGAGDGGIVHWVPAG
jgi:hypothetical protein